MSLGKIYMQALDANTKLLDENKMIKKDLLFLIKYIQGSEEFKYEYFDSVQIIIKRYIK